MILSGTVRNGMAQQRLVEAAKAYSKNVVNLLAVEHAEQVMLQVRVAEVDRKVVKELGINFLFKVEDVSEATPPRTGSPPSPGGGPLPQGVRCRASPSAMP